MVIVRSPFRIPLAGGGTDLPAFFNKIDGFLLSTTIDKYIYLTINKTFKENQIIIKYSKIENVNHYSKIKHSLFKSVFENYYPHLKGVEINCISDLPFGTGMGSSGSLLVAIIAGLEKFIGNNTSKRKIAEMACKIEINFLKLPVGKQDQFSAAYGNLRSYKFTKKNTIVRKVNIPKANLNSFFNSMLLYYTGITRSASNILKNEVINLKKTNSKNVKNLIKVREFAYIFEKLLINNKVDEIGNIMRQHWELKKIRNPLVTNKAIDNFYNKALKNGAIGGKVLGAGGGGFVLLISKNTKHLKDKLKNSTFREVPIKIDIEGVKIINEIY